MDDVKSKKIEAFLQEIREVENRYLFRLYPMIQPQKNGALIPILSVEDIMPPAKPIKKEELKEEDKTPLDNDTQKAIS